MQEKQDLQLNTFNVTRATRKQFHTGERPYEQELKITTLETGHTIFYSKRASQKRIFRGGFVNFRDKY